MDVLPTRATLLCTRIGALRDWGLIIHCRCRRFPRHLEVARLATEYGTSPMLERVLVRLRCERCGQVPVRVEAKQGDPFAKRGMPAVVLLESRTAVDRNRG